MDILTFPGCNSIGLTPALLYDLYHPELAPGLDKVINKLNAEGQSVKNIGIQKT